VTPQTLIQHEVAREAQQTELSVDACKLLPEDWRSELLSQSGGDITVFYSYALAPANPVVAPSRTWLLSEIETLAERLASVITPVVSFAHPSWDLPSPDQPVEASPLRARALSAVSHLAESLGLAESRVADLAGISRNSVRNWRNGQDPYPATVKRLFQLSNLVSALEGALGPALLSAWLDDQVGLVTRRELLAHPDGLNRVTRDAAEILFKRPSSALPPRELLGEDVAPMDEESGYAPDLYAARERRERPTRAG
jgi:transcriptional regulator with XRE-family HTH domain